MELGGICIRVEVSECSQRCRALPCVLRVTDFIFHRPSQISVTWQTFPYGKIISAYVYIMGKSFKQLHSVDGIFLLQWLWYFFVGIWDRAMTLDTQDHINNPISIWVCFILLHHSLNGMPKTDMRIYFSDFIFHRSCLSNAILTGTMAFLTSPSMYVFDLLSMLHTLAQISQPLCRRHS